METLQAIFPARDCALLVAIILLPLIGAFVNGVFGKRLGKEAVTLMALSSVGASFLGSVAAFFMLREKQTGEDAARLVWTGWEWLSLSSVGEINAISQGGAGVPIKVEVAFSVDALSGTMALIVTGVGFLIHLYSTKYMEEDPGYHRFFAYLNLFIFSMLVLILGDSLPVLFVGWEGVGLCSYLLIGFWFTDEANAAAGKKAFIANRIGDFGLLVAMALLVRYTGSLSWSGIAAHADDLLRPITVWQIPYLAGKTGFLGAVAGPVQVSAATLVALSLFLGCAGKSAQFPLYVWLPDAMAGPTPVSALIHAATMVTAGVYLVCRTAPVFVLSPAAMFIVACTGAFTALLRGDDRPRPERHQEGARVLHGEPARLHVPGRRGRRVHGRVLPRDHARLLQGLPLPRRRLRDSRHARPHPRREKSQDMRNMGGLREHLPITHYTFLVSCLAIAGLPPLSGFFSKDEILLKTFTSKVLPPPDTSAMGTIHPFIWPAWGGSMLLAAGILGAVMTAFYMFRLYFLTFWGDFKGWKIVASWKAPAHEHHGSGQDHTDEGPLQGPTPHESPWQMFLPLVVLAVLAMVGGIFMHPLDKWLEPVFAAAQKSIEAAEHAAFVQPLAIGAFFLGAGGAAWAYHLQGGRPARNLAAQFPGLHKLLLEKWRVDELYDELFIGTVDFVADVFVWIDQYVVDGIVAKLTAFVVQASGHVLRLVQTGRIQTYAAVMMIGTASLGWFFTMPQVKAHVDRDDASGHYVVIAAPGLGYEYRWDADADGKPDAEAFSDKKSVELTLGVGESRAVRLEVKNAFGRVGSHTLTLARPKPEEPKITARLAPAREFGVPAKMAALGREVLK